MTWDYVHYTDHPTSTVPDQLRCAHCFCTAGTDGVHYCHRCGKRKEPTLTTFVFSQKEG